MRRYRDWLITISLVALIGLAAPQVSAVRFISGDAVPLSLDVSTGELVELDAPAASVFVADPSIADVEVMSPTLIYVFASAPGQTNILAVNEANDVVGNILLVSRLSVAEVNRSIARVAPGSGILAEAAGSSVLLTGLADSAAVAANAVRVAEAYVPDAAQVINQTSIDGPTQVNLQVRIAEVSRSAAQELGLNWEAIITRGNYVFGLATGRDFTGVGQEVIRSATAFGSGFGAFQTDDASVNVLIDALESAGMVAILAEPNLTTMSGETASFLAGGEFPVPTVDSDGDISISFREFGVSLAFTPTVLAGGRISMRVRPEVSTLSDAGAVTVNGFNIPALETRRAETSVEMGSGESFAIAGLFQSDASRNADGLPFLQDLPILGPLFRSEQFENRETELVIIVTPYLVEPVRNQRIIAPTDPPYDLVDTPDLSPPAPYVPAPNHVASAVGEVSGGFVLK